MISKSGSFFRWTSNTSAELEDLADLGHRTSREEANVGASAPPAPSAARPRYRRRRKRTGYRSRFWRRFAASNTLSSACAFPIVPAKTTLKRPANRVAPQNRDLIWKEPSCPSSHQFGITVIFSGSTPRSVRRSLNPGDKTTR